MKIWKDLSMKISEQIQTILDAAGVDFYKESQRMDLGHMTRKYQIAQRSRQIDVMEDNPTTNY